MLERTEMRMFRWIIIRVSLRVSLKNQEIRKRVGVACITENIREVMLWWFGHMMRRKDEEPIKKVWN